MHHQQRSPSAWAAFVLRRPRRACGTQFTRPFRATDLTPSAPPTGIGLAIAKDFLAQGYTVFANGRSDERLKAAYAAIPNTQRSRLM